MKGRVKGLLRQSWQLQRVCKLAVYVCLDSGTEGGAMSAKV